MTFLVTSYFVALALRRDALHARALSWSRRLPGPFLTTKYVLWEFVNQLSMPVNRARAHAMLAGARENPSIQIREPAPELFRAGLMLHAERADKNWSLTDCISFVVMQEANVTYALTYDRHFEQAGFRALLRGDPDA